MWSESRVMICGTGCDSSGDSWHTEPDEAARHPTFLRELIEIGIAGALLNRLYRGRSVARLLPVSRRDTLHDQELSPLRRRALLSQRLPGWHSAEAREEIASPARP